MALTQKKMDFVKALIAGKSNKDAALTAGYSAATAAQAGSRLAKDPDVKRHLAKLKREARGGLVSASPAVGKPEDSPEVAKAKAAARKATAAAKAAVDAARHVGLHDLDGVRKIFDDPKDYLMAAMNDEGTEKRLQMQAAISLMNDNTKRALGAGKKGAREENAKAAASKFGAPPPPPRMAAVGGKRV